MLSRTQKKDKHREDRQFAVRAMFHRLFFDFLPDRWVWHYPSVACRCICVGWGCKCEAQPRRTRLGSALYGLYYKLFPFRLRRFFTFPLIRSVYPQIIADDLISVQPMVGPFDGTPYKPRTEG